MGKHRVPQFYLKGFSDPRDNERIWMYEKGTDFVRRLPIKGVAQSKDSYMDAVEKGLNQKIESPANAAIEKLRSRQTISIQERLTLCVYVQVMMLRVERRRQDVADLIPGAIESTFAELDRLISYASATDLTKAPLWAVRRAEAQQIKDMWQRKLPEDLWTRVVQPAVRPRIIDAIWEMNWLCLVADGNVGFVTSDNPVSFPRGLGIIKGEVQFPISKRVALLATHRADLSDKYLKVEDDVVRQFNSNTIREASRFVFYSVECRRLRQIMLSFPKEH